MNRFQKFSANAATLAFSTFIFLLFGLFLLPWLMASKARVEAMTTWPMVEAVVIESGITSRFQRGVGPKYLHDIKYRFAVGDQNFAGDRVSYGGPQAEWESEDRARAALPAVGSNLQIRYDPDHPNDSVVYVIRVPHSDTILLQWFAGSVSAAGGILMLLGIIARSTNKR